MIDSVPLIQNANDAQQINASIIAMKKASRELDEKIVKLNSLNSELDKKIALLDSGLNKEIEDRKEAINSLDVSSVGGSGKYISAISETDGKISATASDITSSVSSGNSQPVTSGGVASAMNNPITHDFPSNDGNDRIFHLGTFNSPNNDNYNGAVVELEMKRVDRVNKIIAVISNGRIELLSLTAETLNTWQSEIRLYKTSDRVYDLYLLAKSWTENNFIKITNRRSFSYDGSLVSSYIGTQVTPSRMLATFDVYDTVVSGISNPVTSNAVANVTKNYNKAVVSFFDENMAQKINTEFSACANYNIFYFGSTAGKEFGCYGFKHNNTKGGVCIVMSVYYGVMMGSGTGLPSTWDWKYIITP